MTSFTKNTLESSTGASLAIYSWPCKTDAKAIVHVNHGMAEHCARYDAFAQALNAAGYHVIAHDHRGHGSTTAPDTHQGLFATSKGWEKVIEDVMAVNADAKKTWPGLPMVYFGHSMGSIIGLNVCIKHSKEIDAAALWNSGVDGGILLTVYSALLSIERMFKGSDVPSSIARKLTFETWNKVFKPNRTESDWLSRNETEVDKYVADPLCGFDCCNGLWRDLLEGIRTGGDDTALAAIRNDLPMHLLAGGQDPCSDKGKAVARLATRLEKTGIRDLTNVLHNENRHEALNELNREEIINDFIQWLDQRFAK